ncbi:MAG TPA: hypothetical protein VGP40_00860 [Chthoniobacterales bacterium]|nr:hypothetical protein [Chthoniobacterales bacterium]
MRSRCTVVVYTVGSLVAWKVVQGIATVRLLVVVVVEDDELELPPEATLAAPPVVSSTVYAMQPL